MTQTSRSGRNAHCDMAMARKIKESRNYFDIFFHIIYYICNIERDDNISRITQLYIT